MNKNIPGNCIGRFQSGPFGLERNNLFRVQSSALQTLKSACLPEMFVRYFFFNFSHFCIL